MRLTLEDLQYARPASLFLQARQFAAIRNNDEVWPRIVKAFSVLPPTFSITALIDDVINLGKQGDAERIDRDDDDGAYNADATAVDALLAEAAVWYARVKASLELAVAMKVPDAPHVLERLRFAADEVHTTADGMAKVIHTILVLFASIDTDTYFIGPALVADAKHLAARLADAPQGQQGKRVERQFGTRDVDAAADALRERYIQIARADALVFALTGQYTPGFDYGAVKSDRPDHRPTPPVPPINRLPPMSPAEPEDDDA